MMYCSYGNANRIAPKPEYKDIMVNSARSLISRFSPVVGCINPIIANRMIMLLLLII